MPQASQTQCITDATIAKVIRVAHKNQMVAKLQEPLATADHTFIQPVIHLDSDGLSVSPSPTLSVGIKE